MPFVPDIYCLFQIGVILICLAPKGLAPNEGFFSVYTRPQNCLFQISVILSVMLFKRYAHDTPCVPIPQTTVIICMTDTFTDTSPTHRVSVRQGGNCDRIFKLIVSSECALSSLYKSDDRVTSGHLRSGRSPLRSSRRSC